MNAKNKIQTLAGVLLIFSPLGYANPPLNRCGRINDAIQTLDRLLNSASCFPMTHELAGAWIQLITSMTQHIVQRSLDPTMAIGSSSRRAYDACLVQALRQVPWGQGIQSLSQLATRVNGIRDVRTLRSAFASLPRGHDERCGPSFVISDRESLSRVQRSFQPEISTCQSQERQGFYEALRTVESARPDGHLQGLSSAALIVGATTGLIRLGAMGESTATALSAETTMAFQSASRWPTMVAVSGGGFQVAALGASSVALAFLIPTNNSNQQEGAEDVIISYERAGHASTTCWASAQDLCAQMGRQTTGRFPTQLLEEFSCETWQRRDARTSTTRQNDPRHATHLRAKTPSVEHSDFSVGDVSRARAPRSEQSTK